MSRRGHQPLARLDPPHQRRERVQLVGHPTSRQPAHHRRERPRRRDFNRRIDRHQPRTLPRRPRHTPHDRLHAIQQGDEERGGKHFRGPFLSGGRIPPADRVYMSYTSFNVNKND
jgi:hypothetical protein